MLYDDEKIALLVAKKRRAFCKKLSIILFVIIASLVTVILNFNDYATVICLLIDIFLILTIPKLCKRYSVKILFSQEIKGRNVKEYEYGIHGDGQERIYRKGNMPHTFANKKILPLRLNGTVYLELDDGNITSISGLYKAHMDIYEDKDMLLKYAGTKFPIVIDREVKKQPCPICGEVNDYSQNECKSCKLSIVYQKDYL